MKKALFLDRDGVVNVEKDYLFKHQDFEFIDGVFELIRHFQSLGYLIFIVTNQSGIARGFYSEEDFNSLTAWMQSEFSKKNIKIQKVYFCPHHPDISGECTCRKPKPGMILQAAKEYDVDLKNSILIGDKERDVEAGLNAGLDTTFLFDETETVKRSKATKIVSQLEDIWK
jgi:D-glycero-D-manno-heptose 1,7-bisphosphate phosphatase